MKVAAIAVLYNPDTTFALHNILQYIDSVEKVIIWQNSVFELEFPEQYNDKIILMGNGNNCYMAKPLNEAIRWCANQGYDYLLTMDQDSTWGNFSDFLKKASSLPFLDVAIFSPNINHQFSDSEEFEAVESVITSGALLNVNIANQLGGFREDYKIYWVDGEFCYWARKNNYKIIRLGQYNMTQKFGTPVKNIFNIYVANYSPIVYYFMFRNMLWMKREFGKNAVSLKTVLYTGFLYTRSVLLCESSKTKKMWKISNGFYDGIFGKFQKRKIAQ